MKKLTATRLAVTALCVMAAAASAQRTKPTTMQTCNQMDCHDGYEMKEYLHGPVALGECTGCHEPDSVEQHTFKFTRQGNDLCVTCHLEQTAHKNIHKPLADGACTQCHDPHSSDTRALLKKTLAEGCADCHKVTEHAFVHGPAAVGDCTVCHNPHSSEETKLLTIKPAELCVACHVMTKGEMANLEFVHDPASKGDCVRCHNPHGAANRQMLKANAPEMCLVCHHDTHKTTMRSKVKHDVVTAEGGCLECHEPHAAAIKHVLRKPQMDLCIGCHDKPAGEGPDAVPSFTEQIKGKDSLHGPMQDGDCAACHEVHGSKNFRLLSAAYPAVFYSDFAEENYALCFTCHQKTLAMTKKTADLTGFRNGDRNLHYLHVNKDTNGRTCRACHEPHASSGPKHIRQSVAYGIYDLPVNFAKTETGGSCSPGCHLAKAYDRDNPVDYTPPAKAPVAPEK